MMGPRYTGEQDEDPDSHQGGRQSLEQCKWQVSFMMKFGRMTRANYESDNEGGGSQQVSPVREGQRWPQQVIRAEALRQRPSLAGRCRGPGGQSLVKLKRPCHRVNNSLVRVEMASKPCLSEVRDPVRL